MKFKLFIIFLIITIPEFVFARSYVEFDCKYENNKNICEVRGYSDIVITAIEFKYSLPSNTPSGNFILNENNYGNTNNNWVSVILPNKIKGEYEIGKLIIESDKVINNNDIKIYDIILVDSEYNEISINENNDKQKKNKQDIVKKIIKYVIIILGIIGLFILFRYLRGVKKI